MKDVTGGNEQQHGFSRNRNLTVLNEEANTIGLETRSSSDSKTIKTTIPIVQEEQVNIQENISQTDLTSAEQSTINEATPDEQTSIIPKSTVQEEPLIIPSSPESYPQAT